MSHFNSFVRIPLLVLREAVVPVPRMGPLETDVLEGRVWPQDIDFNLHFNNARYLSVMDYGRVHLLARGGVLRQIVKARWIPVVGAVWITYRRSLPLGARYRMATRLVGWDSRWFYMEQIFTGAKGTVAVGWVKGALRSRAASGGTLPVVPQLVMDMVEPGMASPPLPEALLTLNELTREKLQGSR